LDIAIKGRLSEKNILPFIVFHDAYQYFLRAYGLANMQVGLVQEFHGDNPSQKQIATLMKIITSNNVKTIFTEPQFNPSIVQRLKQETGVSSKEIDPIGFELSKI
jgi:zinc transport system substrate-binding protein